MLTPFEQDVKTYCEGLDIISVGCRGEKCEHAEGDPNHQCEAYFSWVQCDSCGSTLGGDRSAATGSWKDKEEWINIEMEICVDCMMFHANGELPTN